MNPISDVYQRRKEYKQRVVKYRNEMDDILKQRYEYSFDQMVKELTTRHNAMHVKILLNKINLREFHSEQFKTLFESNNVAPEMIKVLDGLTNSTDIIIKLDKILVEAYDNGAKYVNTDIDINDLYRKYKDCSYAAETLKVNANSLYGKTPN